MALGARHGQVLESLFQHEVQMTPMETSTLYLVQALVLALAIQAMQTLAARRVWGCGRVRWSLVSMTCGLLAFAGVVLAKPHWHNKGLMALPGGGARRAHELLVAVAGGPLDRPRADRIPRQMGQPRQPELAGWCGSAALGGYLCDQYGYGMTFVMTMGLQLAGLLVLVPVFAPGTVNTQVFWKRVQVWEIMQTFPVQCTYVLKVLIPPGAAVV